MISKTALTYGGALYDLAQEEHLEDAKSRFSASFMR